LWIAVLGCVGEPDYEGRLCDEAAPCPRGFRCEEGRCTARLQPAGDAGPDGGHDAGDASTPNDATPPDALADAGGDAGDGGEVDAGEMDAGDPILARCDDPIGYPAAGWEVRHFELLPGFAFGACVGVEDYLDDAIARNFMGAGPLDMRVVDFGSRYTATRTFDDGVYTFLITQDDGARILIDGAPIYDAWVQGFSPNNRAYSAYVTAGPHQLTVEHFDNQGFAQIQVSWQRGCEGLTAPVGEWAISYHRLEPMTLAIVREHCYGLETVSSTGLSITGDPPLLGAAGITTDYAIVARSSRSFPGMTDFAFTYDDGLRVRFDGSLTYDDWLAGGVIDSGVTTYLSPAIDRVIELEKFSTTGANTLMVSWNSACSSSPMIDQSTWLARYYRILYSASPESWTVDRGDCLGVELINGAMLMQSGEPAPIVARSINALWGADYIGTRTFGANTTVNIQYDDGLRIYDGAGLVYEAWTAPQIGTDTLVFGAGTHPLRLEYFQNFGGTQCRFTW
jgi:hypothetical protein